MLRDEILNMPVGEEIDMLIAEKVMEIDLSQECDGEMYDEDGDHWSCTACSETGGWGTDFEHTINPKQYSTDIAAAWEVVEKLKDYWFELEFLTGNYRVRFQSGDRAEAMKYHQAITDTAPLAICRAALLAVNYA